jgi:membrane protein YdbS with pleckstrin-like domain
MNTPDKRLYYQWILIVVLLAGIIGSGVAVVRVSLAGVVTGLLLVAGIGYATLRYRAWAFELRDNYLYLEYGVFKTVESMVPYVRIQHVDTQRGVLDRLFGLSRVVVFTAGSRGADVTLPGLVPTDATEMQEALRDIAIESESRDAV